METEKNIPRKLAALVAAFGEKLTGDQLKECLQNADRGYSSPSLSHHQEMVCRHVLADEDVAAWYGFERAAGLENLRTLRYKCKSALEALVKLERNGWYDDRGMRSDLSEIARKANEAVKSYDTMSEELTKVIAEIDATEAAT
jgi:hypothetical protein